MRRRCTGQPLSEVVAARRLIVPTAFLRVVYNPATSVFPKAVIRLALASLVVLATATRSAHADAWKWVTADSSPATWVGLKVGMNGAGQVHLLINSPAAEASAALVQQVDTNGTIAWTRSLAARVSAYASNFRYDTQGNPCWIAPATGGVRLRCLSLVDGGDLLDRTYLVPATNESNVRFFADGSAVVAVPGDCGNDSCPTLLELDAQQQVVGTHVFPPQDGNLWIESDRTATLTVGGGHARYRLDGTMYERAYVDDGYDYGVAAMGATGAIAMMIDPRGSSAPRLLAGYDAAGAELWRAPSFEPYPDDAISSFVNTGRHAVLQWYGRQVDVFDAANGRLEWTREPIPGLVDLRTEEGSEAALMLVEPDDTHIRLQLLNLANGNYGNARDMVVTPYTFFALSRVDANRDLRIVTREYGPGPIATAPRHFRVYSLEDAFRRVEPLLDGFE